MSAEYVREIEEAVGVNPAPRQSQRLASDLEAAEPFDEMTGPMSEVSATIRKVGLDLYRDGVECALGLMEKGFTPAEVREWIGRLA